MNTKYFLVYFCFLNVFAGEIYAAKILGVFPANAKSHFNFNIAIMKSLADAGHEVTVICPFPNAVRHENLKIIDSSVKNPAPTSRLDTTNLSWLDNLSLLHEFWFRQCHELMIVPEVRKLFSLSDKPFDVMFVHLLLDYECFLPPARKWGIPVIGTVSFRPVMFNDEAVGNPHPLVLPFTYCPIPKSMSFYERLHNVYCHLVTKAFFYWEIEGSLQKFYEQHYPSFDAINNEKVSLLFSNNHPSFLSTPLVPTVIEIGGIHVKESKPLPDRLEKFIADAKHGVIFFSMGSIMDNTTINHDLEKLFMDVFVELPQRVIWKFGGSALNITENVLLSNWLPQLDILAHENVKAFISHCGISGTYEAVYTGTPMVLSPSFADQPSNAFLLRDMGVGVYVDFRSLTKEKLLAAIRKVINDKTYAENMLKLSNIFKDRPMSPQESVVYWTEYVLRYNGTEHLDVASRNMPLYQYLLLDVLLLVVSTAVAVFFVLACLLKSFCHLFRRTETTNSKDTEDKKYR